MKTTTNRCTTANRATAEKLFDLYAQLDDLTDDASSMVRESIQTGIDLLNAKAAAAMGLRVG